MFRFLAALCGVFAAMPAHALSVTPITIEMKSVGNSARATITVTNPTSQPTAIEPTFDRVSISENGAVSRKEDDGGNFLIMPLQAVIPPGGTQTFRLQWLGEPNLPRSESYFITFNQLLIRGLAATTGITVLTAFSVAVNVNPAGIPPAITLTSTEIDTSSGTPRPVITVENPTQAHALLKDAAITVIADGVQLPVPVHDFEQAFGTGLLQPWARRRFVLPIDLPPTTQTITARIDYHPTGD